MDVFSSVKEDVLHNIENYKIYQQKEFKFFATKQMLDICRENGEIHVADDGREYVIGPSWHRMYIVEIPSEVEKEDFE